MTAEQVFFALKQRYPAVAMATVYNNLNSLYRQGKIRKINVEGYPDRYDKIPGTTIWSAGAAAALRISAFPTSPPSWNVRSDFPLRDMT